MVILPTAQHSMIIEKTQDSSSTSAGFFRLHIICQQVAQYICEVVLVCQLLSLSNNLLTIFMINCLVYKMSKSCGKMPRTQSDVIKLILLPKQSNTQ